MTHYHSCGCGRGWTCHNDACTEPDVCPECTEPEEQEIEVDPDFWDRIGEQE